MNSILFSVLAAVCAVTVNSVNPSLRNTQETDSRTFSFVNKCDQSIWIGSLGNAKPTGGSWNLAPGEATSFDLPQNFNGNFWGRTGCHFQGGTGSCETGDCGGREICNGVGGKPPITLAEFNLDAFSGLDFYDLSLVDGFNIPMSITSDQQVNPSNPKECGNPTCISNINQICPSELQVRNAGNHVVGCNSACLEFNQDQYCCRGAFNSPDVCIPTFYSKLFKEACPSAYSYAYDDKTSTFTCRGSNYVITFCPSGAQAPTEVPTEAPSLAPTEDPIEIPTLAPTEAPTPLPKPAPTRAPTRAPTPSPTEPPIQDLTESPIQKPCSGDSD